MLAAPIHCPGRIAAWQNGRVWMGEAAPGGLLLATRASDVANRLCAGRARTGCKACSWQGV